MSQLPLPQTGTPDLDLELGDRRRVRVRLWLGPDGARLEAETLELRKPEAAAADLPPRASVELLVTPQPPSRRPWQPTWSMVRGLRPWRYSRDSLTGFVSAVHALLYGLRSPPEGQLDQDDPPPPTPDMLDLASATMRRVHAAARAASIHAAERCDPDRRRLALRFQPCTRFRLYRWMVDDATGRVAQLAGTCPGALVFAAGCVEQAWSESVGHGIVADAVAGLPVKVLLRQAVERWHAAAVAQHPVPSEDARTIGDPWYAVAHTTLAELPALLGAQRLLIRRAGTWVPPTCLTLPPPVAFVPEDIPSSTRANARWYRLMKSARPLFNRDADPGRAQAHEALARFASAHAEVLFRHGRAQGRWVGERMLQLADLVRATGRRPGRATSPVLLLAEARRWHRLMTRLRGLDDLHGAARSGARSLAASLETALPAPPEPAAAWRSPALEARPLATVGELIDEGREMRHCVASMLEEVLAGEAFVYSLRVGRERLTAALERACGGEQLVLTQVKGKANRPPARASLAAVAEWLDAIGAGRVIGVDEPAW